MFEIVPRRLFEERQTKPRQMVVRLVRGERSERLESHADETGSFSTFKMKTKYFSTVNFFRQTVVKRFGRRTVDNRRTTRKPTAMLLLRLVRERIRREKAKRRIPIYRPSSSRGRILHLMTKRPRPL